MGAFAETDPSRSEAAAAANDKLPPYITLVGARHRSRLAYAGGRRERENNRTVVASPDSPSVAQVYYRHAGVASV